MNMELLWNNLNLERPPTSSCKITPNEFDAKEFLKILKKIYHELESQDTLHQEAALLSRLIYRMKRKFKHDKGLKNMEKINRALLNYLQLSLKHEYKYLIDNIVITNYLNTLPTKQMLQYVLIRHQGFSQLMYRIENVAMEAATYFKVRIQLGHAWTVSAIAYAVISRIWMLSRHLLQRCCTWYNKMYPYISKLKLIGIDWLPTDYHLPSDLKKWLSISWIDEPIQFLPLNTHSTDSIFSLIKHQHESDEEIDLTVDMKNNEHEEEYKVINNIKNEVSIVVDDIGEPVSRQSLDLNYESLNLQKAHRSNKSNKLTIKTAKTENDLNKLLKMDFYPGLDKLQWNIIKNLINKSLRKINKCTVTKKRQVLLKILLKSLQQYIS